MKTPTAEQQLAIYTTGNVLVVAGAGTGKTSTLVERCVDRIRSERCRLDRILMVTFTDAAAAEMRHRIGEALARDLSALSADRDAAARHHLEEQLALLDGAAISTLSSFCLNLVRDHFDRLHIDPQVSILDDERARPLIEQTLDTMFLRHYADESDRRVRTLIRQYGNGSDQAIRNLVLKIHRFTQTLAQPDAWMRRQVDHFATPEPARWRLQFHEALLEWKRRWHEELAPLSTRAPALRDCLRELESLPADPPVDAFARVFACIEGIDADRKAWDGKKQKLRPEIARFFDEAEYLASLCPTAAGDPLAEDWACVREPMQTLLWLAEEFTRAYATAKRDLALLDFADIEQKTLELLLGPDRHELTDPARELQQRFDHVLVDEYQDINEVQDRIIEALSRPAGTNGGNRFLVGDVKQSIYRFRLAQPRIFVNYDLTWSEPNAEGRRLPLSGNFRSREGILQFVNALFPVLMRRTIGGLDYPADAQLQFGNRAERSELSVENDPEPRVELHLLSKSGAEEENGDDGNGLLDLERTEREARLIALRLRELRESGQLIHDKHLGARPVQYRDMAVLMRSPGARVESFARQFHQVGVPLRAARAGFYSAPEISDLLCLLKLLDNPLQDIPALAVLRSPLAGLTDEELVAIRVQARGLPWWMALQKLRIQNAAAEKVEDGVNDEALQRLRECAREKIVVFLKQFDAWRELIRQSSLSQCLECVLMDTHYEALLEIDARGAERVANVRRLLDLTRDYDVLRREGLFRFLRFIEAQQQADEDREPAPVQAEDAVQLMSIHRSKGLEFPIVAIANLGGSFNEQNLNEAILLSEELGLCPKACPPDRATIYPTLPHWLARRAERRELLGEEMRLLYVALTRARDRLILAGTITRPKEEARWTGEPARRFSDAELLKTRSFLDWLRLWLPQVTNDADWKANDRGRNQLLSWTLYDADDPALSQPGNSRLTDSATAKIPIDLVDPAAVRRRIEWVYPCALATHHPAKTSVSALRRQEQEDDASQRMIFFRQSERARAQEQLSASAIGTAHHLFQQHVSLDCVASVEDLRGEADRLVATGILRPEERDALSFERLHAFWKSDFAREAIAQRNSVRRELEFTARFAPETLRQLGLPVPALANEFMVIQGAVDLAVILPREIWIADFKTDSCAREEIPARVDAYRIQLAVYAAALEGVYQRTVTRRLLHFLTHSQTISA